MDPGKDFGHAVLVAQQSWREPTSAATGDGTDCPAVSTSETPPEPNRTEKTDLLLRGVQVDRMRIDGWRATAPALNGHVADLTLDGNLQRGTDALWAKRGIPQGAALLLDLTTGRMLVYSAARVSDGEDPRTVADAPAASVFKVITAAALVERDKVKPNTTQCYRGGRSRIKLNELVPDEHRDRSCATVSEAMGQSLNMVFARLAVENLTPGQLERTARSFGFNEPLSFDVPVQRSRLDLPDDDLGFAQTAAGFWNSTLSPVHGVLIASAVAKGGWVLRPSLVDTIRDPRGQVVYRAPVTPTYTHRAMKGATARALRGMMETTVSNGTARDAFRDRAGHPYLPNIRIASKTGTLTRATTREFITWFVGFAPANDPQIAFATVVVDDPAWHTKAPTFTRELLRAYFASRKVPGVTKPS